MAAAATTAALQRTPIAFRYSSLRRNSIYPVNLPLSIRLRLPKLTIKTTNKSRHGGGRTVAKISDSPAGSYATALADLANSNQTLEATAVDIEKIDKLFSEKSIFNFFASPIVTLDLKRELIDDITSSGSLQLHVCNFLNILIERQRIYLIKEIVKEFEIVYNKLTATEVAIVTSVVRLERQHLAQIAKQVQKFTGAKNVRIKTVIDESLVAGFTIRYGSGQSKMIDMSVKKQLEDIAALLQIQDTPL